MKIVLILLFIPLFCLGQPGSDPKIKIENSKKVQVMVLGTFHFNNKGLDEHKTQKPLDIMARENLEQLAEIIKALADFKPDKIALEFKTSSQSRMDSLYSIYLENGDDLGRNEIYQIGFRLAKMLGNKRVYGIDAPGRWYKTYLDMSELDYQQAENEFITLALDKNPQMKIWYPLYEEYYDFEDSLLNAVPLKEYYLRMNSEEHIRISHGIYLVDSFKFGIGTEDEDKMYYGADLKTAWYNRNLRIFENLQRITKPEDERILILIGAGHLPILKHCIEYSPEYIWVGVDEYLKE